MPGKERANGIGKRLCFVISVRIFKLRDVKVEEVGLTT